MDTRKREHAIAVAGIIVGGLIQEASSGKLEPGTLIRMVEHEDHKSTTEVCITIGEKDIEGIALRDHDDLQRCEHFAEPISASLRLADCLMHGAGALRRVQ